MKSTSFSAKSCLLCSVGVAIGLTERLRLLEADGDNIPFSTGVLSFRLLLVAGDTEIGLPLL